MGISPIPVPILLKCESSAIGQKLPLNACQCKSPQCIFFPFQKNSKNIFWDSYTTVPSSAAVERLFSLVKDVLSPKLARLLGKHLEIMFMKGINEIM